ncbi:IS66 family transposase [Noviherbaspirillum saxi]|uniref:IS66 family transposase n=1 Tax=Noviherbaspirillum saxi TaxID=2320863 RepID=UPI001F424FD8|nr:IS66 family transposase [Noviherbaspirillum saxi]
MAKKQPAPDLSGLSHEEKDILILTLLARLDALESKMRKDSHNSSRPPSSDGLTKKTNSLRESSGKPPGGQAGHKGTTLKREQPTQTIDHPLPGQCDRCHGALPLAEARVAECRQVLDVPAAAFDVIEHRTLALVCRCGQSHVSAFPAGVTEMVQYGPNVKALGAHLTQGQMLPYARAAELIQDVYGLCISPGTLVSWVGEASVALQGTADRIAEYLRNAPLLHADESGLRVASKLHWLHIAASGTLTWYGVHAKRGLEAMHAHGILPRRIGILVHDCWAPYWRLDGSIHALCNAHLLRELVYVKEITGQEWPQSMTDFLLNANKLCEAARQKQRKFSTREIAAFRTIYDAIVAEGEQLNPEANQSVNKRGRAKQSIAFNLLRRLRQHADAVLLFISNLAVPFTNNVGERAVRMPKVKQKISGCFRTVVGAENFCVIRSCLDTLRKQGHRMLDVLQRAFHGNPIQVFA